MCQKPRTLPTSARFGPTGYEKVPLLLLYPYLFLWREGGVERLHFALRAVLLTLEAQGLGSPGPGQFVSLPLTLQPNFTC